LNIQTRANRRYKYNGKDQEYVGQGRFEVIDRLAEMKHRQSLGGKKVVISGALTEGIPEVFLIGPGGDTVKKWFFLCGNRMESRQSLVLAGDWMRFRDV